MKFIVGTVLVLAAVLYGSEGSRIVGGSTASITDFPSTVQIERSVLVIWSQMCGGSILTNIFVLSAATCLPILDSSLTGRRIRAGTSFRNLGGVTTGITEAIKHPTFNSNTYVGDLVLLRLEESLSYSQNIQPIAIVSHDFEFPANIPVVVAGWGSSQINGDAALLLQKADVLTVDRNICAQRYAQIEDISAVVTESMLCAGLLDVGGADACQGDSGGPLLFENILMGIVSWGYGCGSETYPGVYTRIASYTNWIVETVG